MTSILVATLIGLCLGSFLNVLVYRLPKDREVVWTPSACPDCGTKLSWYENVPVFGYLWLRGHCRHCGEAISPHYPLVELAAGLILGGTVYVIEPAGLEQWFGVTVVAGFLLVLMPIALIDFRHSIIPNGLNLALFSVGVLLSPIPRPPMAEASLEWSNSVLMFSWSGALVGGGLLFAVSQLARIYYGEVALGMGDVKFVGAAGLWLGPWLILVSIFLGAFLGALVGTVYGSLTDQGLKVKIPFGPFLAVAAGLALVLGPQVLNWWLGPLY